MRALSLFSGIGGIDLGLHQAGIDPAGLVEKDAACLSVLRRRFPDVPTMEDVHEVTDASWCGPVDLVHGGFPCQDLSVAGRRAGLDGERSGLWFEFRRIVAATSPRWVLIENVPGLLSSNDGRDFAVLLRGLVELGYGAAWRVLDAQYFGVAQRRRRVFVVGCAAGRADRAARILFDAESCAGNPPPRRQAGAIAAGELARSLGAVGGGNDYGANKGNLVARSVAWRGRGDDSDIELGEPDVANALRSARPAPSVAYGLSENQRHEIQMNEEHIRQITTGGGKPGQGYPAVAREAYIVTPKEGGSGDLRARPTDIASTLSANEGDHPNDRGTRVVDGLVVRRLTPLECERLQGFPDGWTDGLKNSARYKTLGNAVAVPCARWIGERLVIENAKDPAEAGPVADVSTG